MPTKKKFSWPHERSLEESIPVYIRLRTFDLYGSYVDTFATIEVFRSHFNLPIIGWFWPCGQLSLYKRVVASSSCAIVVINFLCTASLAKSLMAASSYLAYILAYLSHWYTLSNLGIWLMCDIWGAYLLLSVMTYITQIRSIFDVAISCWICSNVISMVPFTHAAFFIVKNHVIKRGLEQKNHAVKKMWWICLMCVKVLTHIWQWHSK